MKRIFIIFGVLISIISGSIILDSCKKQESLPSRTPINFVIPPGFPATTFSFQSNPLSDEAFLLGRKLFYDGRLSIDGNFACATCHQPEAAYTTFEHDRSHGYNHSHTLRNAPGLFNLAWYPVFNQDGSTNSLQNIYVNHITNRHEMAETIPNVIAKLKSDDAYRRMFRAAFGTDDVNLDRISKALSQFLVNLISANTKYDLVLQGKASFDAQELAGYNVFQAKCGSCHKEPLFTDFSFRNTGLEVDNELKDYGRMRVTGNPADSLKFRVPTLRNLDFTSYYLHDGRVSLPRHVIQHYRNGVISSPTVDPLLTNGIQMTNADENNLVLFLHTLTDSTFLNNRRFRE